MRWAWGGLGPRHAGHPLWLPPHLPAPPPRAVTQALPLAFTATGPVPPGVSHGNRARDRALSRSPVGTVCHTASTLPRGQAGLAGNLSQDPSGRDTVDIRGPCTRTAKGLPQTSPEPRDLPRSAPQSTGVSKSVSWGTLLHPETQPATVCPWPPTGFMGTSPPLPLPHTDKQGTHAHTHTYVHAHARTHPHTCTCMHTYTHHPHAHPPTPTRMHAHKHPHTHTLSAHMYTSRPHAYPTHSACLHTHARAHPRAHTHTHIHAPWRTPWEGGPRGTAGSRASAAPRFPGWDLPRLTERVAVELALVCPRVPPTCLTPRARLCRFPQRPPLRLSDLGGPTRTGERGHWPRSPASGRQEPIRDASRDTSGGWPQRSPRHCSRPGDKPCSLCRGSGNREGQRQPLTRLCWEAGGKWGGWQGARPRLLGPRLCLAWRPVHRDPAGRQERVGVVLCTQSCL